MEQAERETYKTRLTEMRARLMNAVSDIEQSIVETITPPGEVSTVHTHLADMGGSGASGLDREILLAKNEAGILQEVERALTRIENGTFGVCENCGREIARERLDAISYTPFCIQCAEKLQTQEGYQPGVPEEPWRDNLNV